MARQATGTIDWRVGKDGVPCWHARVSLADGSRPWVAMPGIPRGAEAAARVMARKVSRRMRQTGAVPAWTGETVNEYFDRWIDVRERKGMRSARNDRGRYDKWISPRIGTRRITAIGKDDLKGVVLHLDEAVQAKRLAWKSAINVWGVCTKLFNDACRSKLPDLCVRDDNPALLVRGPDRGIDRAAPYLFPSEFLALASCQGVPLHWRQIYTLAVYLYIRGGELAALDWADVHLDLGYVHVHRALDTDTGRIKSTKTNRTRKVRIEPTLLPLLREMHREADGEGSVVEMPPFCEWAKSLRHYLKLAGCVRADLFANDETRRHIDFHDLRHTGITWRAIRGDDPKKIQRGAGHTEAAMTDKYINEAEIFGEGFGEVFPTLPLALVGESSGNRPWMPQVRGTLVSPGGFEPPLAT
jgi:integrase